MNKLIHHDGCTEWDIICAQISAIEIYEYTKRFNLMDAIIMRRLVFEALQDYNLYSDKTMNGSEMKTVGNLFEYVEDKIYPNKNNPKIDNWNFKEHHMKDHEIKYFIESLNDFYREGIITWGRIDRDVYRFGYPDFLVTAYGKKVLESEGSIPHDPEGYIEYVSSQVPDISEMAIKYLSESYQCYLANNLFASAIMLGVASESSFNILFDSFIRMNDRKKNTSGNSMKNIFSIKRRFDYLKSEVEKIKNELPKETRNSLTINFEGIFNIVRLQRNDIGHPKDDPIDIDKETMFAYLRLFIPYCKTVYSIKRYFDSQQI